MSEFNPDWVSPPGDTIRKMMSSSWSSSETVMDALGLTPEGFEAFLAGKIRMTHDDASCLSILIGGTRDFWLNREHQYRERLKCLSAQLPTIL